MDIVSMVVLGIVVLLLLSFLGIVVSIYNGLVTLKNNINKAWSNIDVLLKQRSSELPKLIETCKGYMKYEQKVLENVTKARTAFMNAKGVQETANADNLLTGALKSLFAVAENYPDLKANQNFLQLQSRISGIENEIADRREFYNDSVNTFNIKIEQFPDMIIAGMMHLEAREMFKANEEERKDVEVKFD